MIKNILFAFLFLFSVVANAQTHTWERTNPGGGGAFSTIGASTSGVIVAGSDLSGAYISNDDGNSWFVLGAASGMTETHVSGVGFDRVNGDIIYIGTENGIFRSSDGGNTASQVLNGGYITDIEFGTTDANIGYASYHPVWNSNEGVVYKSTNNGNSWSQVSADLPSGLRILKVIVNPNNANIVYILSGEGRFACGPADVYRSINGGVNWTLISPNDDEVLDVAIDPNNPQDVFITTLNGGCNEQWYWTDVLGDLYKSTNGGTTFGSPISGHTGVIWIDANNSTNIHLIDPREPFEWNEFSGTFSSSDGGINFTQTGNVENWDTFFNDEPFYAYSSSFNGISKTLGENLSDPSKYYWVNSQWVFETTDYGTTFNNIFTNETTADNWKSRGFDNVNMMDVVINESNPDLIYLAYFDIGIWRSIDGGDSWYSCNPIEFSGNWDGYGGNCATIISDPQRENVVWASMSDNQNGGESTYLIRSDNMGDSESWVLSNIGLPVIEVMGLSIDKTSPINNRTLFVTAAGDVYKSIDDGNSWNVSLDCDGCRFTAIDKFDGQIVYAGGENGLQRSLDGGDSWEDVSHPEMYGSSTFWDSEYDGIFDVKTDPNLSNTVYVTALGTDKGLYKSSNAGDTWNKIISDDYMRKIAIAPQNSEIIYATSSSAFEAGGYNVNSSGIWYTTDSGIFWTQENQGMEYPFALAIAIDHSSSPQVIVGSPGTGFQKAINTDLVSVEEFELIESISLYPNPTTGYFQSTNDNYSILEIYNLVGELVYKNEISVYYDISNLSVGTYIIKFIGDNTKTISRELLLKK